MEETFEQLALKMRDQSGKHMIMTTNDLEVIADHLRGTAGGAKASRGSASMAAGPATRRGGARRSAPSKKGSDAAFPFDQRFINSSFKLHVTPDGTELVCRKLKRNGQHGYFPVIPIEELEARLEQEHQALGHPGYEQLYDHLAQNAKTELGPDEDGNITFMQGLAGFHRHLVKKFTFSCPTCAYKRNTKAAAKPATTAIHVRAVFELVQIDLSDLAAEGHGKYRYILVVIDHYSKHVWLRALKTKESAEIARHLRQLWADTQRPTRLQSDNGLEFEGQVEVLCSQLGVKRSHGRPYRPQTQGCVERRNSMVKAKLKAARRDHPGLEWPDLLAMVQEELNSAPTRVLGGLSPTQVLFGQLNHGLTVPAAMGIDSDDEGEVQVDTPSPQEGDANNGAGSQPRRSKRQRDAGAPAQPAKRQRREVASTQEQQCTEEDVAGPSQAASAERRSKRAAAAGVAAALQQVANQGMPVERSIPRRAAAAGVAAAAEAAAATTSSDDSHAVGEILLEMAAATAESPAAPQAEPASTSMRPELAAARQRATAAGERNRQCITSQHKPNGEPKNFSVGDAVLLALPRGVHRGLQDSKLLCRIVKVGTYHGQPSHFTLRCNAGILNGTYTPSELSDGAVCAAELNFTDTQRQGVPVVPLATAVAAAAEERRNGKKAAPHCGCRKACGPRCPCRKAGVKCSRECKCMACRGHNCENYN